METVGIDFFTVPTATFRVLFCFVILEHSRRRIVHFNVTEHPTAEWTSLQVRQAFPFETAPKYLLHDNHRIYAVEGKSDRLPGAGRLAPPLCAGGVSNRSR